MATAEIIPREENRLHGLVVIQALAAAVRKPRYNFETESAAARLARKMSRNRHAPGSSSGTSNPATSVRPIPPAINSAAKIFI